jgi:subtilisin family serine protease
MIFRISLLLLAFMAAKASAASIDKQTYIIHMDKNKMPALYDFLGNSRQWYESVIDSITQFSSQEHEEEHETGFPQLLYTYETVTSGFAAKLSTKQVEALSRVDGFLSAIPDGMLTLHTTHTPRFLGLQSGKGLWNAQNLASDVIVGILDTGIWPEHVSFQDSGMSAVPLKWKGKCESGTKFSPSNCNKKLIGARAFFKGYESIVGRINETIDYRSPRDSQGHGTHTAATAAGNLVDKASFYGLANGSAAGMKYTARIAPYKVC